MNKKSIVFWSIILFLISPLYAEYTTLGDMADAFINMHFSITELLVGLGYLSGVGFGIAAVYKFKQYKDNPTQIPIGTPFALLMVSILMVSMPGLILVVTSTIFGGTPDTSNVCQGLPGGDGCP